MKNFEDENILDKYDELGLNYISKQKLYIKASIIFPIFSFIVIILTLLIFITSLFNQDGFLMIRLSFFFSSISFIGIITLISTKQAFALGKWKLLSEGYVKMRENTGNTENYTTLTDIFYNIVDHMRRIKIYFILLNIVVAFYILTLPPFLFSQRAPPEPLKNSIKPDASFLIIITTLNISNLIAILSYLIYMWYHYIHWGRKLKRLKEFEKKMYNEIKKYIPI